MLSDATWDAIQQWVDNRFEGAFSDLADDEYDLIPHGERLANYHGVYVWHMGQKTLVSLPTDMRTVVSDAVARTLDDDTSPLTDPAFWQAALGERVERIVGPSYQGFVDDAAFQSADENGARPLTAADQPALQRFIAACPPDAWQHSAIAPDHNPLIGLERDGELIALASAPLDGSADEGVRSVGVVTLPAWRGRGAGLAVVSALTAHCLAHGAVLHYQTLRANLPSIAIARRLGYEDVATALAIRLR
ncbi:MAG TPA: GNAT family N-acetyltransferase [Ktedonobacterales bacterium]|nr:GNAT family N-acetyltransferase [Ktedonobacterales bacterium]